MPRGPFSHHHSASLQKHRLFFFSRTFHRTTWRGIQAHLGPAGLDQTVSLKGRQENILVLWATESHWGLFFLFDVLSNSEILKAILN